MHETLNTPLLEEFQKFLLKNLGLTFSLSHEQEVKRKVHAIAQEFDFGEPSACIAWLLGNHPSRMVLEKLAVHLSVGETFFFREPKSFEYLEKIYLPDLIRERASNGKYLRIWSAGVASGEEVYSIAILLRQMIPNLKGWNITLLATDINQRLLDKARQGIYSKWSFRNRKYNLDENFEPAGDNKFRISPTIRDMVSFAWLNLAEPVFPAAATNTLDLDIIFCRNVMIYFSGEVISAVTNRFYQSLVKSGILIVSPADMTPYISPKFSRTLFQGYTIYQKIPEKEMVIQEPVFTAADFLHGTDLYTPVPDFQSGFPAEKQSTLPFGNLQELNFDAPVISMEDKTAVIPDTRKQESCDTMLSEAKRMANQGKHEEAAKLCSDILQKDKSDCRVYYLQATIWMEKGMNAEAIGALNKALYLEKDFAMAHYLLGKLSLQSGNFPAGEKSLRYLQKLLSKIEPSAVIPESGELTASGFLELIQTDLATYVVKP